MLASEGDCVSSVIAVIDKIFERKSIAALRILTGGFLGKKAWEHLIRLSVKSSQQVARIVAEAAPGECVHDAIPLEYGAGHIIDIKCFLEFHKVHRAHTADLAFFIEENISEGELRMICAHSTTREVLQIAEMLDSAAAVAEAVERSDFDSCWNDHQAIGIAERDDNQAFLSEFTSILDSAI